MSRDKQIEEMSCIIYAGKTIGTPCVAIANVLYDQGYRKASDVAREVIDNILSKIRIMIRAIEDVERHGNSYYSEFNGGSKTALEIAFKDIAELKKKYESEGEG